MRENRTYGSEGGEAKAFPTPISQSEKIFLLYLTVTVARILGWMVQIYW
jgi:hypothetical protein